MRPWTASTEASRLNPLMPVLFMIRILSSAHGTCQIDPCLFCRIWDSKPRVALSGAGRDGPAPSEMGGPHPPAGANKARDLVLRAVQVEEPPLCQCGSKEALRVGRAVWRWIESCKAHLTAAAAGRISEGWGVFWWQADDV